MRHSRRSQADFPLIGPSEFARPPLYIQEDAPEVVIPALQTFLGMLDA